MLRQQQLVVESQQLRARAEHSHLAAQNQMVDAALHYSQAGRAFSQAGQFYRAYEMHIQAAKIYAQQGRMADAGAQYVCVAASAAVLQGTAESLTSVKYYAKAARCYQDVGMAQVAAELYERVALLLRGVDSPEAVRFDALVNQLRRNKNRNAQS